MLLLSVLQDALGTEHVSVLDTVELDFLLGVGLAVLDLALGHLAVLHGRIRRRCHGQARQHLVVYWQVVGVDLVTAFVVWALDHSVLWQLTDALRAEGVAARERGWFLLIVVVRLETDAALEDGLHHFILLPRCASLIGRLFTILLIYFINSNS